PLSPEMTAYDLAGRVVEVRSRDGLHTTFRRAGETVERQTICEGSPLRPSHTTRVTDARGRLRLTCAPTPPGARPSAPPPGFTGACTTTTYGIDAARGLETDVTVDPVGHAVTRFVDAAGELRAVQDAVRGDITVDVAPPDATGAVERITRDPEGGLTTEVSDAAGRLTARRVAHAPGLDEAYAYQGATRVTTLGTAAGARVETAVVDVDGRLHRHETRSGAGAAAITTLAYDGVGREVTRTDPDGVR
ncbi:hypothetical protein L6V77_35570, partial [Myxococcota bacterium]|nr:hypothetical protein [Myxococcota bacterium]